jgi:hypothetical protein
MIRRQQQQRHLVSNTSVGGEGRRKELGVRRGEGKLLKIIILSFLAGKFCLPRAYLVARILNLPEDFYLRNEKF